MRGPIRSTLIAALGAVALSAAGHAEEAAPYEGKTVSLYVAGGAGGSYGVWAQLLSRHLARHLAGSPTVIAQYMPGAGGAKAANYLYAAAPKDGTAMGLLLKYIVVSQVIERPGLKYDSRKWTWLASMQPLNAVVVLWHDGPAHTMAEAKAKQVVVGSTGKSSETYIAPSIMNALLGTKFKIVTGYKSWDTITVAMERGEVEGRASTFEAILQHRPKWFSDHLAIPIAQSGLHKEEGFESVPRLVDLAKTEEARKVFAFIGSGATLGRIFVMPPGVPAERVAAMRKAFREVARDPAFLAEAKARKMDVHYMGPDKVEALVKDVMATPKPIVARTKKLFGLD